MNELKEIMNGKHEIKHLKIDNDTLSFNTELDNYDWNLTPRDIEMIIYTLQEDKNNLQSKIDKVNRILNANTHVENIYHALCNLFDEEYQYEIDNDELNDILKEDK